MKISDLKEGMVLKVKRKLYGSYEEIYFLARVYKTKKNIGISSGEHYFPIDLFNDDFIYESPIAINEIVEVYDLPMHLSSCHNVTTDDRDCIWKKSNVDWSNVPRMTRVKAKELKDDIPSEGYYIKYNKESSYPHYVLLDNMDKVISCIECILL